MSVFVDRVVRRHQAGGRKRRTASVATTIVSTIGLAALGAPLLAACGKEEMPAATSSSAPADVPLEAPVQHAREGEAKVRVLDTGSGEKQLFEFSPALGEQPTVTVTFSTSSQVVADGALQDQAPLPERKATLGQQVDADVDGAQRAAVTVRELAPTVADTGLDELLASGRGFVVTYQRAADGRISATTLEAPRDARNVARQSVEQLATSLADAAVVLPAEPLGEGARWSVTQPQQDAVAPEMTTTYTLRKVDGHSLILDVSGDAARATGSLDLPLDDGTTVTMAVESYTSHVSGELRVSLTEAAPFFGHLSYATSARYRAPDGKKTETSSTKELKFS